jgi:hypothetical protein
MPISSNNTHISFNNNSTQNTAFLGSIAAANITGTITGSQIGPATITAPNIAPGVIPSGGFSNMQVFAAPGAFTTPPTTTRIKVTVIGGGGGGNRLITGAGAGGGSAVRVITVTGATPYPVTVGAAGAIGPAGCPNAPGGAGGTTSFGSPALVSATGGAGGFPAAGNVPAGGTGSGGDINMRGGDGGVSYNCPGSPCFPVDISINGAGDTIIATRRFAPGASGFGGGGFNSAGSAGSVIVEW